MKPERYKKLLKHPISIVVLVFVVGVVSFFILLILFRTPSSNNKTEKDQTGSVVISEKEDTQRQADSPESGPLDYRFIMTINNSGKGTYIYVTKEFRDERLIILNDQVLSELKNDGKISESTKSYMISYFSDETTAVTYFSKINDKSLSTNDRLKLKDAYIASMTYEKALGLNVLIKISTAKILKQY